MEIRNNLILLADRLQHGKWLINQADFDALAKQVDARLAADSGIVSRMACAVSELTRKVSAQPTPAVFKDNETDPTEDKKPGVAIIEVNGILVKGVSEFDEHDFGLCNPDRISLALDEAIDDDTIKAVCLKFASPGGEVLGIEILARKIARLSEIKPIIGWTETQAASAAYWLMSQCSSIGLTPDASAGSIGVIWMLMDYSKQLEKDGVTPEIVSVGEYKTLGSGYKPFTDDERAILKEIIGNTYIKFTSAVKSKRNIKDEDLKQALMHEGTNLLTGQGAIEKGFADFTSDTLTDYLVNNKENIMSKNFIKFAYEALPSTVAVVPSAVVTSTEEPKQEPVKAEAVKAEDETNEEMKHVKMEKNNKVACPHCSKSFAVDPYEDKEKQEKDPPADDPKYSEDKKDDEPEAKSDEKADDKDEFEGKGARANFTMGELLNLNPVKAQNKFQEAFNKALADRYGK